MNNPQKQLENAFALCSEHDNQKIKHGHSIIQKMQTYPDYPMLLLDFLKVSPTFDGKLRAVIQLKLWCQRYKELQEFQQNQYNHLIEDLKSNILLAYLSVDDKLAATLLIGINAVSVVQFPDRWDGLLSGLMTFSNSHPDSTLRVLELLVEISNKYSYMTRSDPLYKQIIIFCAKLHDYVLNLTRLSMNTILDNQNNRMNVKILQNLMVLFYNMNYQDLPPQFEDNLNQWMDILNRVMQLPNANQGIFKCKGAALQSILLYASKYKEDVQDSIKGFSEQIWGLCANAKPDPDYDDIVFNALKYFRSLILWADMRQFFSDRIGDLISNLILPNITITKESMYSLEDDTDNFINNYFRNGETGTRRSSALDLLKTITRNFPAFQSFLQSQIYNFDTSSTNIQGECMLLTLITDCAPKAFRDVDGVTQLYIDQQIILFCYSEIIKKNLNNMYNLVTSNAPIQSQMNKIHLIVILRFLFYFRVYLPLNELPILLKLFCMINTNEPSLVQVNLLMISSFASIRHGDFLLMKAQKYYFDSSNFPEVAKDIFNVIMNINNQSKQLNGSLTRLFYLAIKNLKQKCDEYYDYFIGPIIVSMLGKLDNYDFTTVLSLFQAVSHVVYYLSLNKSDKCADLQKKIHNFFEQMIHKQSDLLNFCFQILSIFLLANPGQNPYYQNIYESILSPDSWRQENLSIMASYIQYITAFLGVYNNKIIDDKNLFENIFSKLIEIQHFDLFYRFLNRILKITGIQGFIGSGYMGIAVTGTQFIFEKNIEGRKNGLLFMFQLAYKFNADMIVNCINSINNGFFEKAVIENQDIIKTIQAFRNRKIMFGALCNALVSGCFSANGEPIILNLLIENSLGRMRNFSLGLSKENNKDSAYQKLQVFKEIQQQQEPINLDEQSALLQSYTICLERNPQLQNQILEKNQERIKRLYERQKR